MNKILIPLLAALTFFSACNNNASSTTNANSNGNGPSADGLTFTNLIDIDARAGKDVPVRWSSAIKPLGNDEYNLFFKAEIKPEWCVYSQFLDGMDGPAPTTITFESQNVNESDKPTESGTSREEGVDKIFNVNIIKFHNDMLITRKVKVTDKSKPVEGYLSYMTCDNTRCLPPTDVSFSIEVK